MATIIVYNQEGKKLEDLKVSDAVFGNVGVIETDGVTVTVFVIVTVGVFVLVGVMVIVPVGVGVGVSLISGLSKQAIQKYILPQPLQLPKYLTILSALAQAVWFVP